MRLEAKLFCLAAAGLLMSVPVARAQDSAKASQLLAAAKQASGGAAWDALTSWHESGQITMGGQNGSYSSSSDLHQLGLGASATIGGVTLAHGFDGKTPWASDPDGVHKETDPAAIAAASEDAYVSAYGFFFPDRFPAQFDYAGQKQADGVDYDAVKVTPQGATPFEIWIDRKTHLISRFVEIGGPQPEIATMSDFAVSGGITAPPHHPPGQRRSEGGGAAACRRDRLPADRPQPLRGAGREDGAAATPPGNAPPAIGRISRRVPAFARRSF